MSHENGCKSSTHLDLFEFSNQLLVSFSNQLLVSFEKGFHWKHCLHSID
jgi:hypothetical protein